MMATESIPRATTRCFPNLRLRITLYKKNSIRNSSSPSSSSSSSRSSLSSSSLAPSSPSAPKGIRTREEELREVFRHFDMDEDGKISPLELRRYFASIGERMSEEDAQVVIEELDSDKDGMLDFRDFVKLMDASNEGAENDDDLKKVFETFEEEKGSGRITPKGLQRALSGLGDFKSYNECVTMIQIYDVDGDGELNFNEFHHMMAS